MIEGVSHKPKVGQGRATACITNPVVSMVRMVLVKLKIQIQNERMLYSKVRERKKIKAQTSEKTCCSPDSTSEGRESDAN